jgi:hypothetical protein
VKIGKRRAIEIVIALFGITAPSARAAGPPAHFSGLMQLIAVARRPAGC